ncbi:MAG TPA: NAD(+) synthase [Dehalococcoidia bacterium]|nr:NAD(+) synthase [Dehalococcoidia bacterium]
METEQLAEKLAAWIRDRVITADCRGTVFGLSGGIDSAVVAVLCKRVFPDSTLGVLLPCYSNPEDEKHARMVADKFAIQTRLIVLDKVYDSLSELLPEEETSPEATHLTRSNLKVRLRMVSLYYLANQLRYLVVGSSNRSELAVGYFTKYGDGGVDIVPLGNMVKSHVRDMARFLGIPREIIEKPPSAGLWPGQTDEAELGLSYDDIDRYLLTGKATDEVREKIEARMAACHHKRQPPALPDF